MLKEVASACWIDTKGGVKLKEIGTMYEVGLVRIALMPSKVTKPLHSLIL
jgi:hypothetical protein